VKLERLVGIAGGTRVADDGRAPHEQPTHLLRLACASVRDDLLLNFVGDHETRAHRQPRCDEMVIPPNAT